jgi:hypothetical protein
MRFQSFLFRFLLFHSLLREIESKLSKVTPHPPLNLSCQHQKHLTFWIHPPPRRSGGFGDRLRGLVTTFYQSLVSNSSFTVDWKSPYSLSTYFKLHSCPPSASFRIEIRKTALVSTYYDTELYLNDLDKNIKITSTSLSWPLVVRNPKFRQQISELGLERYQYHELFQLAIDSILLSPREILTQATSECLNQIGNAKYLAVQLRVGGSHLWPDPNRTSFDQIPCFAKEAIRLCALAQLSAVFVTGDHQDAIDLFKSIFPVLWRNSSTDPVPIVFENFGTIAHTDRSSITENQDEVWLKSIVDWWLLRHASALVISRSSFGETAAFSSPTLLRSPKLRIPLARTLILAEDECTFVNTMHSCHDAVYFGLHSYKVPDH